jgi:hypothetical protein
MKLLLLVCALLAVAVTGAESRVAHPYVGLFADDAHYNNCWIFYTGTDTEFDTWVWWLPSERGLHAVLFHLSFPSNVIPGEITLNPDAEGLVGCNDGVEPYCATFLDCQYGDWVWSHRQSCLLISDALSLVQIAGTPEAASCEPGYPAEPLIVMPYLILNYKDAVRLQTWGAIKSLYR